MEQMLKLSNPFRTKISTSDRRILSNSFRFVWEELIIPFGRAFSHPVINKPFQQISMISFLEGIRYHFSFGS